MPLIDTIEQPAPQALGAGATPNFSGLSLNGDLNLNGFRAVALSCDNGPALPSSPALGQWFLHTPAGRQILFQYNGHAWVPIFSFIQMTIYVDGALGTDDQNKGFGSGADAFRTVQFAINQIPPMNSGNITVDLAAGAYSEAVTIQGKSFTGAYSLSINGGLTQLAAGTLTSAVQGTGATQGSIANAGAFPVTASSSVNADSAAGGTALNVAGTASFTVGGQVVINPGGPREEVRHILSIPSGTQLTVNGALQYAHLAADADQVVQGAYANRILYVNGAYRIIDWNTADKLAIVGTFDSVPAGAYTVYDWGTVIQNSGTPLSINPGQRGVNLNFIFLNSTASGTALNLTNAQATPAVCKLTGKVSLSDQSSIFVQISYMGQSAVNPVVYLEKGSTAAFERTKVVNGKDSTPNLRATMSCGLFVRAGCVFDSGVYRWTTGLYASDKTSISLWTAAAWGYPRIRNFNQGNGLYAEFQSSITFTSTNQYSGNTTDESANAATYGYID